MLSTPKMIVDVRVNSLDPVEDVVDQPSEAGWYPLEAHGRHRPLVPRALAGNCEAGKRPASFI